MRKKLFITGVAGLLLFLVGWGFLTQACDYFVRRPVHGIHQALEPATASFVAINPAGQKISAWWYQGKPGAPAILLCHGHSVRHEQLGDIFLFLRKKGVSLLLFDFRAHGQSEGEFSSLGLHEWEDIDVVLKEAEKRGFLPPQTPLAAYGRSMGAAALANGAGKIPRIQAFILESMYPELRTVAGNDAESFSIPDCFLVDAFFAFARFRTGIDFFDSEPSRHLKEIYPRPLLLIHDGKDRRVTNDNFQKLVQLATWSSTLIIPEARHVLGHKTEPQRFETAFFAFLASAGFSLPRSD